MDVELLAPAGNTEALDAAIAEGADAVYFGLKSFNARMRGANFAWNQAAATIDALHKRGKKAYITVNTVLQENECEKMYRFLAFLEKIGVDAIIVQDLGVVKMARLYFPKLKLHASTQMNIASSKGANMASREGISRIVLARELSLAEIRQLHTYTNCELEVFIHGSLCISESGLCMFSSYLGGKSANRGMCTQACRRFYKADAPDRKQEGYFFSPFDLQLIDVLPQLLDAGVASFKIEGRMKSAEYVGQVVKAYRYMLDNYEKLGSEAIEKAKDILKGDFSRSKTQYHIFSPSLDDVLEPNQAGGTGIFLGKIKESQVLEYSENEGGMRRTYIHFEGERSLIAGDSIRIHEKNDKKRESTKILEVVNKGCKLFYLVSGEHKKGDFVYLIQEKNTKRYPHILPKDLSAYRLTPQGDVMPPLKLEGEKNNRTEKGDREQIRKEKNAFPEGLFVQVSSFKNIVILTSSEKAIRPSKLIVNLNDETRKSLHDFEERRAINPFSKKDTIISFDPFIRESQLEILQEDINFLVLHGYRSFVANNLAHIKMLKEAEKESNNLNLIAGPYLYTFNRYALKYLEENKINKIISPIENSESNVASCYPNKKDRSRVLLTVFSYPALFRISAPLPQSYDFLYFFDKENEAFKAFSTKDASFVLPEKPFSITHRIGALRRCGFERFLIDFSHTTLNAKEYKFILESFAKEKYIEGSSYFNWKDGFYKEIEKKV